MLLELYLGDAVLHPDGPEREAGVEVAVKSDETNSSTVPAERGEDLFSF